MAASKFHAKMSAEQKAALDSFYRDRMGFDPAKITDEQFASAEKEITKIEKARYPSPVNPWRDEISDQGGYDREAAERLATFKNWHSGVMPSAMDANQLVRAGVPKTEIERLEAERQKEWVDKARAEYAIFTRPETTTTVMQPEVIAAKPPKVKGNEGKGAASQQAPVTDDTEDETLLRGIREGNRIRLVRVKKKES